MTSNNFTAEHFNEVIEKFKTGQAKEHAYRPALASFFKNLTGLNIVNDPRRSEFRACVYRRGNDGKK